MATARTAAAGAPAAGRMSVSGVLALVFALEWLMLAWRPLHVADWALENVLTLAVAGWLVYRHRRQPLSKTAYGLLFVFATAHIVGAHYTYAEVPYDRWMRALSGHSLSELLGLDRNHYDRLVHFLFGLLCYQALMEMLAGAVPQRAGARRLLTIAVITAISTLYELLEWGVAMVFGGDLGQAYLGTQGDIWDAHKDMALALLGCCIAGTIDELRARISARRAPT